ncbi:MAG TPA: PDZ domain-containing protein [Candidatus Handelsmanbacteria bacterium]|nr:PDZ domain-containing protein [Candidatus Handelsmanbacteria bacterium]
MKKILLLASLLLSTPGRSQEYRDVPTDLASHYGVLGLRPASISPDSLAVEHVMLYSEAHRAGIQKGDRIIAIPPYRIRNSDDLSRCIQSYAPGDTLSMVLYRDGQTLELSCSVSDVKHLYYLMNEQGTAKPITAPLHIAGTKAPHHEQAARDLIRQQDASAGFSALRKAWAFDAGRYGSDTRLQTVNMVLHDPLTAGRTASALSKSVSADASLVGHLHIAAQYLDLAIADPLQVWDDQENSVPHLILASLLAAEQMTDSAFAKITDTERAELANAIPELLKRFGETFLLDSGDSTETVGHINTLRLAKKVDLNALFIGALHLAQLADGDALKTIRKKSQQLDPARIDSLPPGTQGKFLYAKPTPLGWILVGDRGPNLYTGHTAAIIDLGGDDIYFHSEPAPANIAIIIDYEGDDRYIGGPIAAGIRGIGMLVDLKGNDLYKGGDLALGTAFCGIGMLWDSEGDDNYINAQVGQGAAFFGAGLLVDRSGNDFYSADLFAQGFGGMRGFGLLHDLAGDDHYLVDRAIPSSYGTPNTYAGWAQGIGCGFRGYGSGGIGLLLDGDGDDHYQGGDFAQGVGYFFGMGVLADIRGDDQYRGSRYAQGAAAHQAVGALIETGGNDHYETKIAASQGAGWDAAIGYLADLSGDDRYLALHLSQGAAAMNGLGLLFDGNGRDRYETQTGQGQGSSATYWGGRNAPNLGLLIDLGGNKDTYSIRKNQADAHDAGIGLFSDR